MSNYQPDFLMLFLKCVIRFFLQIYVALNKLYLNLLEKLHYIETRLYLGTKHDIVQLIWLTCDIGPNGLVEKWLAS